MKTLTLCTILLFVFGFELLAQSIDYSDFNSGGWDGWTPVNGTSTNRWELGSAIGYNTSMSVYISNDNGTTNGYNTSETSIVHIYKDIDFSVIGTATFLTFKWSSLGETNLDYLNVHLVPTNITPVAGQELTDGIVGKSEYSNSNYFKGARIGLSGKISEPTMRLVFSWRNDDANGEQPPASIDDIEVYSASYNYGSWTTGTSMPGSRYYAGSLRYGYSLTTSGGYISGGSTNETLEYNLVSGRWGSLPSKQNNITLAAGLKFDGALWSVGGYINNNPEPTDEVRKLDLRNFSWSSAGTFSYKVFYARALLYKKDFMYVLGGSDETNTLHNDVNYIDKNSLTWLPATPMPGDGRADGGAAILENRLIYIGGFTNQFERLQVDSIFVGTINPSDPSDITWTRGTNFPGGPRARFHAYPWGNNQVIVVGGSNDGTGAFPSFNDLWVYNIDDDAWTQLPNKPTPVTAYQGASYRLENNVWKLVITGGVTTGPVLTTITEEYVDTVEIVTSVEELQTLQPNDYQLQQNYPNPFNPSTSIQFSLPLASFVKLEVFNALGEKVDLLVSEELSAGTYKYNWDAKEHSSGIYLYKLTTADYSESKKMILIK
jgi:hypothetical protein